MPNELLSRSYLIPLPLFLAVWNRALQPSEWCFHWDMIATSQLSFYPFWKYVQFTLSLTYVMQIQSQTKPRAAVVQINLAVAKSPFVKTQLVPTIQRKGSLFSCSSEKYYSLDGKYHTKRSCQHLPKKRWTISSSNINFQGAEPPFTEDCSSFWVVDAAVAVQWLPWFKGWLWRVKSVLCKAKRKKRVPVSILMKQDNHIVSSVPFIFTYYLYLLLDIK